MYGSSQLNTDKLDYIHNTYPKFPTSTWSKSSPPNPIPIQGRQRWWIRKSEIEPQYREGAHEVTVESIKIEALDGDGPVGREEDGVVHDGVGAEADLLHEPVVVGRQGELQRRWRWGRGDGPSRRHRTDLAPRQETYILIHCVGEARKQILALCNTSRELCPLHFTSLHFTWS